MLTVEWELDELFFEWTSSSGEGWCHFIMWEKAEGSPRGEAACPIFSVLPTSSMQGAEGELQLLEKGRATGMVTQATPCHPSQFAWYWSREQREECEWLDRSPRLQS